VGRTHEGADVIRRLVRFLDQRTSTAPLTRKTLRYLFPDHWSFLLGEVALYCFIVLVVTGTYLALFYNDSVHQVVYHGPYAPLRGQQVSEAYRSVVEISTTVKAGLLIRQTHHWAADVFVAAIVLHLLRIFFTGAYRKPREVTYWLGLTILMVSLLEGYLGYSLVDDLLSGMGLAIGNAVAISIPFVGANLGALVWGGPFPGSQAFFSRMYIAHVFLIPALIAVLLTAHLLLVALKHHTQFRREPRQTERKLVGVPTFPGQAPRSLGLMLGVAAILVLLGGLVQINPIWLWGPYHTYVSTNGAQPDWYLGWLIGALRLMPSWDLTIGHYTLVPNPFWGGALFPMVVFAFLYLWPLLERRVRRDYAFHNVADRPRDAPARTAIGVGVLTWVLLIFVAGASDRVFVYLDLSYDVQLWFYRVASFVLPFVTAWIAYRACVELKAGERVEQEREAAIAEARADAALREHGDPDAIADGRPIGDPHAPRLG
jgi:ubiquinol-cytochrome c reductase cytochrome b subunit